MEMKSIISFLLILQAIINVSLSWPPHFMEDRHMCRGGDFKSITVKKNRESALNKLSALLKNSSNHGFHYIQAGNKPEEQVSANLLCNPNVEKGLCGCCFKNAVKYLLRKCPNQNEGVAWDLYPSVTCMVRYSTGRKIFSVLDDWAWYTTVAADDVKAVDLAKTMDSLTSKLKEQAAGGNALQKFASGNVSYDQDEFLLHAAVQCTPDLSKGDCLKCLSKASTEIRSCCTGKEDNFDGRVLSANCYIWFSHIPILDPPTKYGDDGYCN